LGTVGNTALKSTLYLMLYATIWTTERAIG